MLHLPAALNHPAPTSASPRGREGGEVLGGPGPQGPRAVAGCVQGAAIGQVGSDPPRFKVV